MIELEYIKEVILLQFPSSMYELYQLIAALLIMGAFFRIVVFSKKYNHLFQDFIDRWF